METLPILFTKVLQILAARYGRSCTLEEMTALLNPVINTKSVLTDNMFSGQKKQAIVLDALIVLNDEGHLFLNSITDESAITIKGLIAVDNKTTCN